MVADVVALMSSIAKYHHIPDSFEVNFDLRSRCWSHSVGAFNCFGPSKNGSERLSDLALRRLAYAWDDARFARRGWPDGLRWVARRSRLALDWILRVLNLASYSSVQVSFKSWSLNRVLPVDFPTVRDRLVRKVAYRCLWMLIASGNQHVGAAQG